MENAGRARTRTRLTAVDGERRRRSEDWLATEEPLDIRVSAGGVDVSIGITMRTPGNDFELAAGFLLAEGIIPSGTAITRIEYCVDKALGKEQQYNQVTVQLASDVEPILLDARRFAISSACGVCGRGSVDDLVERGLEALPDGPPISAQVITGLPATMEARQRVFTSTGGLHAAALFDAEGRLLALREDVGRHNAVDKVLGWAALNPTSASSRAVLLVSGRSSFEIVQKCVVGRVATLCAVSAPSSLAVDLARRFDLTLVGFLRGETFNVYAGERRISARVADAIRQTSSRA